jgi:hypothetical protein
MITDIRFIWSSDCVGESGEKETKKKLINSVIFICVREWQKSTKTQNCLFKKQCSRFLSNLHAILGGQGFVISSPDVLSQDQGFSKNNIFTRF